MQPEKPLEKTPEKRTKTSLYLDTKAIHEYQRNRYPFLMIDTAVEVIPGISAKGYKNLTINDWFFECHFKGDPTMPGMLQIEALVQMCALTILTLPGNKGKIAYLSSAKNLSFKRKVLPGDRLDIDTRLNDWKRGVGNCSGTGSVSGELACKAEFILVLPDVLTQYRIQTVK